MRILTVLTGGTIGSSVRGGVISPVADLAPMIEDYQKSGAAVFDAVAPYTILSENMDAEHLKALRHCIESRMSGYDGVIVTHGTDTLQYTAAYLDLVLGAQSVPVVLVSANYPLEDSRSNGADNFNAAADFILGGAERGVFVSYRNRGDGFVTVHRGSEVLPHAAFDDRVFSVFNNYFGTIQNGIFVRNPLYSEPERVDMSGCELNGRVLFLRPYVGMTYPDIPKDTKAILFEGWHSGTLPTALKEFRDFCKTAGERKVPVYLTGSEVGFEYESKLEYESLGINVLPPCSPVYAYMKLFVG